MSAHPTYRDILESVFKQRANHNARYSLRAFARDLDMSPTSLSDVLNGKKGLSSRSAARVSEHLNLPIKLRSVFCDLVDVEHARSPSRRKLAKRRLGKFDLGSLKPVDDDRFKVICEWYHLALIELTNLPKFKREPEWIAKRLNITAEQAEQALERLLRLGYLQDIDGRLVDSEPYFTTTDKIPTEAIREFHQGILKNLQGAIDTLPIERRRNEALICSVSKSELKRIAALVEKFHEDVVSTVSAKVNDKSAVYAISLNMWDITIDE